MRLGDQDDADGGCTGFAMLLGDGSVESGKRLYLVVVVRIGLGLTGAFSLKLVAQGAGAALADP